jgi:Fe-Mn family superoxide dismutase
MNLKELIGKSVRETFTKNGITVESVKKPVATKTVIENITETTKNKLESTKKLIKEAINIIPQSFSIKTERLSDAAKKAHEQLYKTYVEAFNKSSSALDAVNVFEANSNKSEYRSQKIDETYNFNAAKLHELYFYNIGDQASEISVDALPYMRLSRDFGTFEKWQFNFLAACKAARSGWAILVFEPYRNVYMNCIIDSHDQHIPVGAIPVLVMDMWEHAYFLDYQANKDDYIVSMLREVNWNVVEARMMLAEKSDLSALYMIRPVYNTQPQDMLNTASTPPITDIQGNNGIVPPTTPPGPSSMSQNSDPQMTTTGMIKQ